MKNTIYGLTVLGLLSACSSDENSNLVVGEMMSDRIELSVDYAEPITAIPVQEGETVVAGQILLQQDDARAVAALAEVNAALMQAQARLDELVRGPRNELITAARANVEGATQEYEFRQSEQQRFAELHQRGLASTEVRDRADAALDSADAALKLRLAQLEELLAGTTIEELSQAEQAVKLQAARRDSAQINLDRLVLKAPTDGIIDSRLFELGERPGSGQPVLVMLPDQQPHARVYVPEALRSRVSSGTRATIHIDGLEQPIAGRVRVVASEAAFTPYYALTERDRGRLSYVAKIDVSEDRDRLPDGIPVQVEFEID